MLEVLKQIATNTQEAGSPVAVMFGTVTKVSPIEVLVDQRLSLSNDGVSDPSLQTLILTEKVRSLAVNDSVVLLRVQGGQQFVVIDKVV
ncbi:DUF2577 family protein [Tumebacillus algifaecis]|nr:DUF2577 family protein [Tumebacillus algifaecis]